MLLKCAARSVGISTYGSAALSGLCPRVSVNVMCTGYEPGASFPVTVTVTGSVACAPGPSFSVPDDGLMVTPGGGVADQATEPGCCVWFCTPTCAATVWPDAAMNPFH